MTIALTVLRGMRRTKVNSFRKRLEICDKGILGFACEVRHLHVCMVVECHVSRRMGGAEYQAHLLAEELSRREGARVTYLGRDVPELGNLPYAVQKIGHGAGIRGRAVFFDAPRLWRELVRLQPDVIYQRIRQSYTAVCALYSRRYDVPLVFHSASDPDVGGQAMPKPFSVNLPFDVLETVAGRWGVRHSSHVVVQTSRQQSLLKEHFGREPAAVVRNFQPLPQALPAKEAGHTRVLWVGNMKELKRPELFLQLAERFVDRRDVEFWMVGRRSSNFRFRATMSAIEGSPSVRYFGELPLERVNALMDAADIFVNTSVFEGSPNTFIQAWARGAVVTTLTVDIDGGLDARGIGYRAATLEQLVETVDKLSRAPGLRREIADRAFEYVRREHSLANVVTLADLVLGVGRARQ